MPDIDGKTEQRSLLNIEAVASLLGVSIRHVRRLVAERPIPFLRWGHLLRFHPVEIEVWLDEARRPVRSEAVDMAPLRRGKGHSGTGVLLPERRIFAEAVVPRRGDGVGRLGTRRA